MRCDGELLIRTFDTHRDAHHKIDRPGNATVFCESVIERELQIEEMFAAEITRMNQERKRRLEKQAKYGRTSEARLPEFIFRRKYPWGIPDMIVERHDTPAHVAEFKGPGSRPWVGVGQVLYYQSKLGEGVTPWIVAPNMTDEHRRFCAASGVGVVNLITLEDIDWEARRGSPEGYTVKVDTREEHDVAVAVAQSLRIWPETTANLRRLVTVSLRSRVGRNGRAVEELIGELADALEGVS